HRNPRLPAAADLGNPAHRRPRGAVPAAARRQADQLRPRRHRRRGRAARRAARRPDRRGDARRVRDRAAARRPPVLDDGSGAGAAARRLDRGAGGGGPRRRRKHPPDRRRPPVPQYRRPRQGILTAAGSMNGWLARHRPEIRLSLQMTVAGLAAYAVGHWLLRGQVYWAVLTAVIVTQSSIGGSLKASFDRFFGTIGGAAWGVAVSLTVPHANALSLGAALAIALIPLAVEVALWPRYRVAPVTAAIVLLGTAGQAGVATAALD